MYNRNMFIFFPLISQTFYKSANQEFESLKQQADLMEKRYEELSKYFAFDKKKSSMEEFFGDITAFLKDFEVHNVHILNESE